MNKSFVLHGIVLFTIMTFFFCNENSALSKDNNKQSRSNYSLDMQGHRGAKGLVPENTWPAFRKAIDAGMTTIELDLHITKELELIINHDPTINSRNCYDLNGNLARKRLIANMTVEQIKKFDCSRVDGEKFSTERISLLTFKELLEHLIDYHKESQAKSYIRLNLDIKWKNISEWRLTFITKKLLALLDEHRYAENILIQSYNLAALKEIKKQRPSISTSALFLPSKPRAQYFWQGRGHIIQNRLLQKTIAVNANSITLHWYYLTKNFIKKCHDKHVQVVVFSLNKKEKIQKYLDWGVDGIVTDLPEILKESYAQWLSKNQDVLLAENGSSVDTGKTKTATIRSLISSRLNTTVMHLIYRY